jgi:hypothetical protein
MDGGQNGGQNHSLAKRIGGEGYPILSPRSRSFGKCLRDRRKVAASVTEEAVDQQPHTPVPAGRDQGVEVSIITQARINLEVVDRVVAMAAGAENQAQQQAIAAPGNQMIEPPLQPWQPVHLALKTGPAPSRLPGTRGGRPATRSRDQPTRPRHLLPQGQQRLSPDSHTLSGGHQRSRDRAGHHLAEATLPCSARASTNGSTWSVRRTVGLCMNRAGRLGRPLGYSSKRSPG